MDMVQHVWPGVAAAGAGPAGGAFAAPPPAAGGGTGRRRPRPGRGRGSDLCCDAVQSFTVALLVLLPAAYLTVFELSDGYPGGDPAMLLLFVLPLLLLPFAIGARAWADHRRAALRWFGHAVVYYAAYFLAPFTLFLVLVSSAFIAALDGTWTPDSPLQDALALIALAALVIGGPVVVALLMVAPWAVRGLDARPALAVLANLVPAFMVLTGAVPAVIVIIVHLVFTRRVMPTATLRRSHRQRRPTLHHPTNGPTGDRP
ncbi:hypothetical protein ACIGZJ_17630 [Kitasatospora sp. NPDC052868]|uniref:hypothetical protein n=1 Tax=Kitasatospora sp. NPDC052868 TaxID=3364060 RepID=UPI0037C6FEF1